MIGGALQPLRLYVRSGHEPGTRNLPPGTFLIPVCPDLTISSIKMDRRRGSMYPSKNINPREGKKMVKINLLPERPEVAIWGGWKKPYGFLGSAFLLPSFCGQS